MPQSLRSHLLSQLSDFPPPRRYRVAFSGGLDSTVLLHLMAGLRSELGVELAALHVDHGLSRHSAQWAERCRAICERLEVPFGMEQVLPSGRRASGLEAAARHARYGAFERVLGEDEVLLLAHHRDDQAETLMLQLLRGGGVHGLAAMPRQRPLGRGVVMRPLLEVGRNRLMAYAQQLELEWIDDPSNFDTSLERNFLRHTLLPQLEKRRTGVSRVLARSAGHFAESAALLDELAAQDRLAALLPGGQLSVKALQALSPARCRNLLRYYLRKIGLTVPQHRPLQRILDEVLCAADDAMPLVTWPGAEVRRYRNALYCMQPLAPMPPADYVQRWDGADSPKLPAGLGKLALTREVGEGIAPALLERGECELRQRRGGERLQPLGRGEHHSLKKLYQEAGVPPWERDRRPLLYLDGELVQVPGLWTAIQAAAKPEEVGVMLQWSLSAIENGD